MYFFNLITPLQRGASELTFLCAFLHPSLIFYFYFQLNPNLVQNALAQSSSHWNDGRNHLIFSVFPSKKLTNTLGKAMQAASGLSSLDYRPGFDISLPAYSILQEQVPIKKSSRQFLVVMPQTFIAKPHLRNIIQEVEKSGAVGVKTLEPCIVNHNHRCDMDGQVHKYPDILSKARKLRIHI